jgi:hypothetical protein
MGTQYEQVIRGDTALEYIQRHEQEIDALRNELEASRRKEDFLRRMDDTLSTSSVLSDALMPNYCTTPRSGKPTRSSNPLSPLQTASEALEQDVEVCKVGEVRALLNSPRGSRHLKMIPTPLEMHAGCPVTSGNNSPVVGRFGKASMQSPSGYRPEAPRKEHSATARIKALSACPASLKLGHSSAFSPSVRMPTVPEVPEGEEHGGAALLTEQPKHARLSGSEESFSLHVTSGIEQVVSTVQAPDAVPYTVYTLSVCLIANAHAM